MSTNLRNREHDDRARTTSAALALLDGVPLTSSEAGYVEAARAANTLTGWCAEHGGLDALPAVTFSGTWRSSDGAMWHGSARPSCRSCRLDSPPVRH